METTPSRFEQYTKYADALRNWLIVYGVGGIALLYSQDTQIDQKKIDSIAIALLLAVFAQVMIALINKWHNLIAHLGDRDSRLVSHPLYNILIIKYPYANVWLNVTADIASLVAFLYATYLLLISFT